MIGLTVVKKYAETLSIHGLSWRFYPKVVWLYKGGGGIDSVFVITSLTHVPNLTMTGQKFRSLSWTHCNVCAVTHTDIH